MLALALSVRSLLVRSLWFSVSWLGFTPDTVSLALLVSALFLAVTSHTTHVFNHVTF